MPSRSHANCATSAAMSRRGKWLTTVTRAFREGGPDSVTTTEKFKVEMGLPAAAEFDSAPYKRYANDLVRSSIGRSGGTQPIAFFCECGSSACLQTVWLTRREYDDWHNGPRTRVVARRHAPDGRLAPAGAV